MQLHEADQTKPLLCWKPFRFLTLGQRPMLYLLGNFYSLQVEGSHNKKIYTLKITAILPSLYSSFNILEYNILLERKCKKKGHEFRT